MEIDEQMIRFDATGFRRVFQNSGKNLGDFLSHWLKIFNFNKFGNIVKSIFKSCTFTTQTNRCSQQFFGLEATRHVYTVKFLKSSISEKDGIFYIQIPVYYKWMFHAWILISKKERTFPRKNFQFRYFLSLQVHIFKDQIIEKSSGSL